ncbi:MAG: FlgD immunoglobulin-like domain containing protein [Calditrichia bacterium]
MKRIVLFANCILVGFFLCGTSLFAQDWVKQMEDPEANFYEIQESFESYWQGREITKGSGWKQFKRWEYFMEPRVYPTGKMPRPDATAKSMRAWKSAANKTSSEADWQPLGPSQWNEGNGWNPGIGRVNCSAVDPQNPNKLYVGAPSGGFWRSTDGGQNWETTTDNLPVLGVTAIAIDPANTDVIYIGTGDGDAGDTYSIGVLRSTDGGTTWQTTGLNWNISQTRRISKILIDPSNTDVLIAATNNGVHKSTDAGASWTQRASGNLKDIEFKPGDPSIVYAAGTSFLRSTNGGDSFSTITQGTPPSFNVIRLAIAVTSANPDYVYLLAGNNSASFLGVFRSEDSGASFTQRSSTPNILGYAPDGSTGGGQAWYDLALAVSPSNPDELYSGGVNIWKSLDGGTTWTINAYWFYPEQSIAYVHADIHSLDFHETLGGAALYAGSDGGLWSTNDNGTSWTERSRGVQTSQFYRFSNSPVDAGLIIGGTQDNGTNMLKSGSWTHVLGADGMEAVTDYSNADIMYGATQNGGINRSFDGGETFSDATSGINEGGAWVTPYVIDPEDPEVLYSGYRRVWKTENRGSSWSPISQPFGSNLTILAIAPSSSQTIYAGYTSSLSVTQDGGANWTNITSGLPAGAAALTYVAVSNVNPDKVWATFSGFSNGNKVFESTDAGASWTNISRNLPNIPVNCVVQQQNANDALYVGTDNGIYYRRPGTGDWEAYNTNLPNVIVQELEIHYASQKLRAATYGRGIWESPLSAFGPSIVHEVVEDTEDLIGPYIVDADFSQGSSPLTDDSLFVYYGLNGNLSDRQVFTSNSSGASHRAEIPGSGVIGNVTYFISISDSLDFTAVSPANAPAEYYSFYTGPDTIPPMISHVPIDEANILQLPLRVEAQATDNTGLGGASVDFTINGGTIQSFDLNLSSGSWTGNFPFSGADVTIGDVVQYEVVAVDNSGAGNETRVGPYQFMIEKFYEYSKITGVFVQFGISVSDTISVSTSETLNVRNLDVRFNATHTNTGDFKLVLTAPDGTSATIVDRPGHPANPLGSRANNPDIVLKDAAALSIENITFGPDEDVVGTFQPSPDFLSGFSGALPDGNWILTVSDELGPFSGSFDSWGIKVYMDRPTGIGDEDGMIPSTTYLHANYPNPFNPETTLRYDLQSSARVELTIFNLLGQKIRTLVSGKQGAGNYSVKWDGRAENNKQVASGVYIFRLKAGEFVQTRKMMLLR